MSKFAPLLEPITLSNGITLANRFVLFAHDDELVY